jgi:hypothetical protein
MDFFKKHLGIEYFDNLKKKKEAERKALIKEHEERIAEAEKKAEQGSQDDQNRLIGWYKYGLRDEYGDETLFKDIDKAFQWTQKAAKSGNTAQQIALCSMYLEGEGCEQNLNKGMKLYEECASQKLPVYKSLGFLYLIGNEPPMKYGPAQDYYQAFKWFKLAVDEIGDDESKYELGVLYLEGKGTAKNVPKARALFEQVMQDTSGWYYCPARDKLSECN